MSNPGAATLDELLGKSLADISAMSDEEIQSYLAEALTVCPPVLGGAQQTIGEKMATAKRVGTRKLSLQDRMQPTSKLGRQLAAAEPLESKKQKLDLQMEMFRREMLKKGIEI